MYPLLADLTWASDAFYDRGSTFPLNCFPTTAVFVCPVYSVSCLSQVHHLGDRLTQVSQRRWPWAELCSFNLAVYLHLGVVLESGICYSSIAIM